MAPRRHHLRDGEFNTPAEMLARLAFLVWLASIPSGILLTLAGFLAARWPLIVAGIALLTGAWLLRDWLRRREPLETMTENFDNVYRFTVEPQTTRIAQLSELLREWDALEQQRGTPRFDPWAVQALRNDIHALVEQDPALRSLFRAHRQAA